MLVTQVRNRTARQELRISTRADHDEVDRAFSRFDLSNGGGYGSFLCAQAIALIAVERALDNAGVRSVIADWDSRRRSHLIQADLQELGIAGCQPHSATALPPSPEAILGALYVLEGSRLGGMMLERRVPTGLPRRFLGAGDATRWHSLVRLIDDSLTSSHKLNAAIGTARDVFGIFAAAAATQARIHVVEH